LRVLFDTSTLVASSIKSHASHSSALAWLVRAREDAFEAYLSAHTLGELYATLSSYPISPRLSPKASLEIVDQILDVPVHSVQLSTTDYRAVLQSQAALGLAGGSIFDALIAAAAKKVHADVLLTLNLRDFERVWPDHGGRIRHP
jgi:predicted nucleic acid-binding protein